ncbi:MAG TPA: transcriptional repressor LexA [Elusimicrobiota bacterium]|jgi:repressor LexA|nr:transcriptional repressor LexA [Elusimicrobiota bacterium]
MAPSGLQARILEFISERLRARSAPPTLREIAARFGLPAASSAAHHVRKLEEAGLLKRRAGVSRGLAPAQDPFLLPILGRAAAGSGVIAQEDAEGSLEVGGELARGAEYLLRIKGDSMVGAGIMEGDLVQVRRQEHAQDGEIVVALVGEEAVVKRLRRGAGGAELRSENPAYAPISGEFRILGKVVGLIRRYGG